MNHADFSPAPERDSSPSLHSPNLQIPSAARFRDDKRQPIKHILIGSPAAVQHTMNVLHHLGYAEVIEWARPLRIDEPLTITPTTGDVISVLVRYLAIE